MGVLPPVTVNGTWYVLTGRSAGGLTRIWNCLLCPGLMVPKLAFPMAIQLKAAGSSKLTTAFVVGACPSLRTAKNWLTVPPFATFTLALDGMSTGLLTGVSKVTVTVASSTSSVPDGESNPFARTVRVTGAGGGVADVELMVSVNVAKLPAVQRARNAGKIRASRSPTEVRRRRR